MLYDIVVDFLGPAPVGLEFLWYTFSFILFLLGFSIVFVIFNSIFNLFKRGR